MSIICTELKLGIILKTVCFYFNVSFMVQCETKPKIAIIAVLNVKELM